LIAAKGTSPHLLYMKTDSHWNDVGAFVAYREVIEAVGIKPLDARNFTFNEVEAMGGDLAGELSLAGRLRETRSIRMTTPLSSGLTIGEVTHSFDVKDLPREYPVIVNKNKDLPKLLFFHDSFGAAMLKFLPYHFSEVTTVHTYQFAPTIVLKEKPDYVIFELVERYTDTLMMDEVY